MQFRDAPQPPGPVLKTMALLSAKYAAGAVRVGLNPDSILSALRNFVLPEAIFGMDENASLAAVRKNYRDVGALLLRLLTTNVRFAMNGKTDEGVPFGWDKWFNLANTVGRAIADQQEIAWDSSEVVGYARAMLQTGKDLTDPKGWPWWLKLGVGGVVVGLGLNVYNTVRPRR